MPLDRDELAGVVDSFGALTRAELRRALDELAFRRGDDPDPDDHAAAIDAAIGAFALVEVDGDDGAVLVAGPTALPTLPRGGTDLPHLLDVPHRSVAPATRAAAVRERLDRAAADAAAAGDRERAAELLEVCYEAEAWGPVDAAGARDRLGELAAPDG